MPSIRPRDPRDLYQRALGAPRPLILGADAKPKRRRITRGSRPNAGLEAIYRERLDRLIAEMGKSVLYWTKAIYRANEPPTVTMAMDESDDNFNDHMDLARDLHNHGGFRIRGIVGHKSRAIAMDRKSATDRIIEAFDKLKRRWLKQFDEAAPKLARWFAVAASKRSDATLQRILRHGGFSVKFTMTPAARNIIDAAVAENVSLIRSIPSQYFIQVEGAVMRSVRQGGDLGTLAKELRAQYGVTKRRAALIARDQNFKATADMTRARQIEKGYKAIWRHSHGGKEPRPTHVAQDGKVYDPIAGWLDPAEGKRIWPGTLINCFPASTRIDFAHDVEKAFRHRYCGQLTAIVTDTDKTLAATPNHPILTLNGWKPIGLLNEGDHVIEISDQCIGPRVMKCNTDDGIPLISQIFEAFPTAAPSRVAVSGDFHGDVLPDGNIDIVFADWPLSFGRQSLVQERMKYFYLPMADQAALAAGACDQLAELAFRPSHFVMSSLRKATTTFRSLALHSQGIRGASPSNGSTGKFDALDDGASSDLVLERKRQHAFSSFMLGTQKTRVIRIYRSAFDGHIYNLQTVGGWYAAGGIIAHNCRCFSQTLVPGFEP